MKEKTNIQDLFSNKFKTPINSNIAISYTRVSTKEQAETNASLDTQRKTCVDYCQKKGYNLIQEFGGTYESAKSDNERKEFQHMIQFAKSKRNKVQFIVVYSLDRFSRTGSNAMSLIQDLNEDGIQVIAVTQQADLGTPEGKFQTGMLMLASKYDNDIRSRRIKHGMASALKEGYWMAKPPFGYSKQIINGKRIAVPDENAKYVKRAFDLKEKGRTNVEILRQLKLMGLSFNHNRLLMLFRNPFYCGVLMHSLLQGEMIQGKHEAIVSIATFKSVNNCNIYYEKAALTEDEKFPLKGFIICAKCGTKWVGYTVKAKKKNYYKCNLKGCKCNKNADKMHGEFARLLLHYKISEALLPAFKKQLSDTFKILNKHHAESKALVSTKKNELEAQIKTCQTRFALGQIPQDVYATAITELRTELGSLESDLIKQESHLSNSSKFIEFALKISRNIDQIWVSSNTSAKVKLQYLLFPNGIQYNLEDASYRTIKTNSVFQLIATASNAYGIKNNEQPLSCSSNSSLVVPTRIELVSKV